MSKILAESDDANDAYVAVESGPYKPKVMVLLATYNGELWLEEQLQSILAQKDVDIQVLVGDDVSKDGTVSLLENKFEGLASIKVAGWDNSSGSAGANFRRLYLAADVTEFDFVALADQDDIWLAQKLSSAIERLNQSGAVGYSSAVKAFWPDGRSKILSQNNTIRTSDFLFEGAGQGCTFLIRAETFKKIQSFCQQHRAEVESLHYHDWLIYILIRAWEMDWYFDTQFGMLYRQHAGNEIGSRGGYSAIRKRLRLIRNGWYSKQVQAASFIYALAGGKDGDALRLTALLSDNAASARRLRLAYLVLKGGRRRLVDRLVLMIASIFGWL